MHIFVTGGNGFIGHTLVRHLLDNGDEVKVIDIRSIKFSHPKLELIKKSIESWGRFSEVVIADKKTLTEFADYSGEFIIPNEDVMQEIAGREELIWQR